MSNPRLLSNRYELSGETLGYGGMSEVHRGHDVRLGREVAVKILRADLARDPQFQERFRREAQNAAALNHPAIVAVYDTGETQTEFGPLPYIVMEYVEGRTLRDIVKTEGPMSEKRAMEVMADVCAALDFSHRHGIVHRDVKPANVMITKNGAVKVMDFGIARAIHDGQAAMTQTAAVIGTAQYLSPEQARGENVDARSDVYAAGCVLYELVTGEPPFTGDSPVAVAYQHVREDPRAPSTVNPAVSPELDAIVLKALAKGPANRYQSAAEMRSDMVRTLSGQRPAAPMVMADEERTRLMDDRRQASASNYDDYGDDEDPAAKRRRRNKLIAIFVALGVVVIALALWLLGVFDGSKQTLKPMPDVRDQLVQSAETTLRDAGFVNITRTGVQCKPQPDGTTPCTAEQINKVISTTPGATVPTALNAQITLFYGEQPGKATVPDLKGKTREDAAAALTAVGLVLDTNVDEVDVDNINDYNKVVNQDKSAGSQIDQGTKVHITVGRSKTLVTITDYTGKTFDEAQAGLKQLKFNVTRKDVDSSLPQGQVVSQKPNAGQYAEGTMVTLEVSTGSQQQIAMPDLQGMTEDQALSTLRNAGWEGNVSTQDDPTSNSSKVDRVTRTSPPKDTKIAPNQNIILFIGKDNSTPTSSATGG
jgi:serine/threonine-protein kinase